MFIAMDRVVTVVVENGRMELMCTCCLFLYFNLESVPCVCVCICFCVCVVHGCNVVTSAE